MYARDPMNGPVERKPVARDQAGRWFATVGPMSMTRANGVGTVIRALPGDDGLVWIAAKLGDQCYGVPMNAPTLRDFGLVLIAEADAMDERAALVNDASPAGQSGARVRDGRKIRDETADRSVSRKA